MTTATLLSPRQSVRPVLWANAIFCGFCAAFMLLASTWLAETLDIDRTVLLAVGAALALYAPVVAWFASHRPLRKLHVMTVFQGDLAWCVGAVALIAIPGLLTNTARIWLAVVTIAVADFTILEWLRRDSLD